MLGGFCKYVMCILSLVRLNKYKDKHYNKYAHCKNQNVLAKFSLSKNVY